MRASPVFASTSGERALVAGAKGQPGLAREIIEDLVGVYLVFVGGSDLAAVACVA